MVNLVFLTVPTFYMCTLKLQSSVIKQMDKYKSAIYGED
jgi:hypothetical protein